MAKEDMSPRFGPERWVTLRDTGEHVKVEAWSTIAAAYRVRSRKRGVRTAHPALGHNPRHREVVLMRTRRVVPWPI